MIIKTTLNLRQSEYDIIAALASEHNISISFIINSLVIILIKYKKENSKTMERVQYQKRKTSDCDEWHKTHVSFRNDIYEKSLDMRKIFKFSVSGLVSEALASYLNLLINDLKSGQISDNYPVNYIQFRTHFGFYHKIITLWNMVEPEELEKIYTSCHET